MKDLDRLLNQLQRVVQGERSTRSKVDRESSLYNLCNEGLERAMNREAVTKSFCSCLDKAVNELGALRGIRAIMSQIVRAAGDMISSVEKDDQFCEADQAIIEFVVDFGLSEIAKICKQKLDEEN